MIDAGIGVSEFGMVGLGVMGRNLLLNIADHGHSVSGYDLTASSVHALEAEGKGKPIQALSDPEVFVKSLKKPRCITMLVPAGAPVDAVIKTFKHYLEPGDILIDSGNSYYKDTDRRIKELEGTGISFFGMGISGGEEGARHGPSMMAGGSVEDYNKVRRVLEAVAAKAEDGQPCVAHVGVGSAGHYVKMVHNGIEYAIMQLIAECYDLMKRGWGMSNAEMADTFHTWSESDIGGFLLEITETVLRRRDEQTQNDLVDMVRDEAKEKGTGKWTSQDAMDLRVAVPTIDAAVNARELSDLKEERVQANALYRLDRPRGEKKVALLERALHVAMVASYAQGMAQLRTASAEYGYGVKLADVAAIWRAGCIIRSSLLREFTSAYRKSPELPNLLLDEDIASGIRDRMADLNELATQALRAQIPIPAFLASLAYIQGYTSERLPANLIQAQRDYFGAHQYGRIDAPADQHFHTHWAEKE